jgi:mono/diheme cytochrome c family protein
MSIANRLLTTLVVFAFLLLTAVAFAQGAIATGEGETVYATNCIACHQLEGQGLPTAFPPLAGHVPLLIAADGGRDYLVQEVLYGLQGEIEIAGEVYNGIMPPWGQLTDQEVADVLNYVSTAWGNEASLPEGFAAFTAEEVAAQRGLELSGEQVLENRPGL